MHNNARDFRLYSRAFSLAVFTVAYNILEGIASIFAGVISNSIALVGFGLDSFIESLSGSIMIWRFRRGDKLSASEEEKMEERATKLVAITFFILGVYVLYESIKKLYLREVPEPSLLGIIIALFSIVIMPMLFYAKHSTGKKLGSRSLFLSFSCLVNRSWT
jgi:divalent metal cation (Fe/Co/Zn/Cd) transporter